MYLLNIQNNQSFNLNVLNMFMSRTEAALVVSPPDTDDRSTYLYINEKNNQTITSIRTRLMFTAAINLQSKRIPAKAS